MSVEDKQITAVVRRVLVSHWVDITEVYVRTTRGNVYISGEMKRITAEHSEPHPGMLDELHNGVSRIHGVVGVYYDLANWERSGIGQWLPKRKKP